MVKIINWSNPWLEALSCNWYFYSVGLPQTNCFKNKNSYCLDCYINISFNLLSYTGVLSRSRISYAAWALDGPGIWDTQVTFPNFHSFLIFVLINISYIRSSCTQLISSIPDIRSGPHSFHSYINLFASETCQLLPQGKRNFLTRRNCKNKKRNEILLSFPNDR